MVSIMFNYLGVKGELEANVMELTYDTKQSFWLAKDKVFKLVGKSVIKKK